MVSALEVLKDGLFVKAHKILWDHFEAFFYENLHLIKVIANEGFRGVSWGRFIEGTNLTMGLPEINFYFKTLQDRYKGELNDNLRYIFSILLWEMLESEGDFGVAVLKISQKSWIPGLEVSSSKKVDTLEEVIAKRHCEHQVRRQIAISIRRS